MATLELHSLHYKYGSKKKSLRVGRGNAARKGNKGGKGSNGNQQRSGFKRKWGFEGGQTPLNRRLPIQHRINNFRRNRVVTVTIDMLSGVFGRNISEINDKILIDNNVIGKHNLYKIVKGKKNVIPHGIKVYADAFSQGAKNIIESAKSTWALRSHQNTN